MRGKKKALVWVLLVVLLAALACGLVWHMTHYIMVDFRFYPRDARTLDLRGKEITVQHYQRLSRRLPECEISWDVPFQNGTLPDDTQQITVTGLTDADVAALDYFRDLKTVNAEQCTDYDQLLALCQRRPELEVNFDVVISGQHFDSDAKTIRLETITQEELPLLSCLRSLESVTVLDGANTDIYRQVQSFCHDRQLKFGVELGGKTVWDTQKQLRLEKVTGDELNLLQLLPEMTSLHLVDPEAPAEDVAALSQTYPNAQISWEKEICGKTFSNDVTEVDLSDTTFTSLEEVEAGMAYFPEAEMVFLGEQAIDNEEIAAYRERAREDYKVVWIVRCGDKLPTRTDATSFMPSRDGVGYFKDEWSYNLRYCEDMIAIDVGHMGVKDISFVAYMPNLKYLILAHTEVSDITPISNCKNLIFLELDWSPISDYTPLLGCTALEDLNIGKYGADVTPICQMTWLKNVWCVFRPAAAGRIGTALPNTHVVGSGNATVSSGWRNLPNYYAMRDALNMYYMKW